jgi:hypothetical protein
MDIALPTAPPKQALMGSRFGGTMDNVFERLFSKLYPRESSQNRTIAFAVIGFPVCIAGHL